MQGFTLIEVLLSVAIIAILSGLSLPVYETFARRNDLDVAAQSTVETIRKAETFARGVNYDSVWGVYFTSASTTFFKGATYATRDTSFDEVVTLPGSITQSGLTEITFTKVNAIPSVTGTLTMTSSTNSVRTIVINGEGSLEY